MNTQTSYSARNLLARTSLVTSSADATAFRIRMWTLASCLFAVALLAGCASTKVTESQRLVYEQLPKPGHIWIYDFAASPADVPAESELAGKVEAPAGSQSEEQAALGRQLGTGIAAQLVDAVRKMGLPAERGVPGTTLQVNDIVIHGYLVSIEQGSAAKRMTIGFGAGGSELTTVIEGFQMTAQGLRKLGSATTGSKGNKTPGAAVGAAGWLVTGSPIGLVVSGGMKIYGEASGSSKIEGRAKKTAEEIADRLKDRFKEEGWIN